MQAHHNVVSPYSTFTVTTFVGMLPVIMTVPKVPSVPVVHVLTIDYDNLFERADCVYLITIDIIVHVC